MLTTNKPLQTLQTASAVAALKGLLSPRRIRVSHGGKLPGSAASAIWALIVWLLADANVNT